MRRSLFLLTVFALPFFGGCDKKTVEAALGKAASSEPVGADFATEYEGWKTRAVREFPDLGKAGTPMNTRFVARAKQLSEQSAEELKYPNWPYLLAVKISAELAAAPEARVNSAKPGQVIASIGKVYTVEELKSLGTTMPGAAVVMGRVTKFDEIGMPPGVLMVVLDDTLKCELTMFEVGSIDGLSWLRSGSTISLVRQTGRGASPALASLSMGQVLRVEGAFSQKRGAPVLVGTARRD
jgi:hypothetical protein